MAAGRIVLPGWFPALDQNGVPIPNVVAFFYLNDTTTLATVYTNSTLTTPLPNPVPANASGQFPAIWADDANLFSVTMNAPYGPPGQPFTFDDIGPSTSFSGGSTANKLDRDGSNAEEELVPNIGAARITGDTFTGPVRAPKMTGLTDTVFGTYENAVANMTAIRSDLIPANNFRPYVNGFEPNGISVYGSLDAVALYGDAVLPAGTTMNVSATPTAYTSNGATFSTALNEGIPVGSLVETQHPGGWWRCQITAFAEDRKSFTCSAGWFKQGQTTNSTPTGTTAMWVNAATRAWVTNFNAFILPTGPTNSAQVGEFGVINERGPYVEDPEGGLVGINDCGGIDIVSFGEYEGSKGVRVRGNMRYGYEVVGMPGKSAFVVSRYADQNPLFGFDYRATTGLPFHVAPFVDDNGDDIQTFSVQLDGSVNMGRRVGIAPVSLNLFSSGTSTISGVPDSQLLVSGGNGGGFAGTARWRQNDMRWTGPDDSEQFTVGYTAGSVTRVGIYGGGALGPARIAAERPGGSSEPANLSLEAANGGRIRVSGEIFKNNGDLRLTARNTVGTDVGLIVTPGQRNSVIPTASAAIALGEQGTPWQDVASVSYTFATGASIQSDGGGNPNGRITAPAGSLFLNASGGANNTLWVKESGSGNTGWVAK